MGTELRYIPGSFYRISDRTGFATRAERTQREWQGLIVEKRVWEPRQPQDFVRGVNDIQTVPYPRPRQTNVFVGPNVAQFEVYGDNPLGPSFEVQNGQIAVSRGIGIVNPANFPSGF
jgi:hypothetical protein